MEFLWALQPSRFQVEVGLHLVCLAEWGGLQGNVWAECQIHLLLQGQGGHHAYDTDMGNSGGRVDVNLRPSMDNVEEQR